MTQRKWWRTVCVVASYSALALASGCQLSVGESDDDDGGEGSNEPSDSTSGGRENGTGGSTATPPAASGGTSPAVTPPAASGGSATTPSNSTSHTEVCGAEEVVENGDRDHAQPLGTQASFCVDGGNDHDWFYVDVPDDGKAHVIRLDLAQAPEAWVQAEIYAKSDFSKIGGLSLDEGVQATSWVSVGSGTRTLFDFSEYIGSEGLIDVKTTITPEKDDYEPNSSRAEAAAISAGSQVRAQFVVPYTADDDRAVDDWFKLELTAGTHVFSLDAVPVEVWFQVDVTDSNNVAVHEETAPNKGATFETSFEVETAGTYYFRLHNYINTLPAIVAGAGASFLTDQYAFVID